MAEAMIYVCRGRAQAIDSVGAEYEAWRQAHAEAVEVRDVERWVEEGLAIRGVALSFRDNVRRLAIAGKLRNLQGVGEAMLRVFDAAIHVLALVQEGSRTAATRGSQAGEALQLDEALAEVRQAKEAFGQRWPWIDPQAWERSRKEIEGGRFATARSILHELRSRRAGLGSAGVSEPQPPS